MQRRKRLQRLAKGRSVIIFSIMGTGSWPSVSGIQPCNEDAARTRKTRNHLLYP